MTSYGFVWKNKDSNQFIKITKINTHIGYKDKIDFTFDIETATRLKRVEPKYIKQYNLEPINVIIETTVKTR